VLPLFHLDYTVCTLCLTLQVEAQVASVTKEHDRSVTENEERVTDAINAIDELEQEKQQLLRQLDERQRYCV